MFTSQIINKEITKYNKSYVKNKNYSNKKIQTNKKINKNVIQYNKLFC